MPVRLSVMDVFQESKFLFFQEGGISLLATWNRII